jgi:3-hydroxybutyryl-CoA dehydratase
MVFSEAGILPGCPPSRGATGMAMLECTQKVTGPVRVNDSIHALVEVTGIRPTSKGGRAIVDSGIEVFNQRGESVLQYTARRMLAGRPSLN